MLGLLHLSGNMLELILMAHREPVLYSLMAMITTTFRNYCRGRCHNYFGGNPILGPIGSFLPSALITTISQLGSILRILVVRR